MLGSVVQDAVGGCPVPFGAGDASLKVGVLDVEERQRLGVGLLGVRGGVVHTADAGSEQVCLGQVPGRVVTGRLGVDEVGDPVLDMRMVGFVDLDLVAVVVGGGDRGEPRAFDSLGQAAEPGEEVHSGVLVVTESTTTCGRSAGGGSGHADHLLAMP